jgi:hypothetical protein
MPSEWIGLDFSQKSICVEEMTWTENCETDWCCSW